MATLTYYLLDAKASGINHLDVQDTVPTTATASTGWVNDNGVNSVAGEFSELRANVTRAATTFVSGAVPTTIDTTNGNGWRLTASPINGTFAAGSWTIGIGVIAAAGTTAHTGRFSVLFWKSSNADGSGGSAVGTRQVTATSTTLNTTAQTLSLSYDPSGGAGLTLSNEYLFLLCAWEVVTTSNGPTFNIRQRAGTAVQTTNFTASSAGGEFTINGSRLGRVGRWRRPAAVGE